MFINMTRVHALAVLIVVGLASKAAFAHTSPYNGSQCQPQQGNCPSGTTCPDKQLKYSGNTVKNTSSTSAEVICPIVKSTSSFGMSGDNLTAVTMTASGGSSVSCFVDVWDTTPDQGGPPTKVDSGDAAYHWAPGGSSHNFGLRSAVTSINTWYGPNDNFEWRYAELDCTISAGTTITSYSTTESGSVSTSAIYPPSFCKSNGTGQYLFFDPSGSGYLEATGETGTFSFTCPISIPGDEQHIYVALGPTINNNFTDIGCEFANNSSTRQTLESQTDEWPIQTLAWSGPLSSPLVCSVNGSQGDPWIVSFLTWTLD